MKVMDMDENVKRDCIIHNIHENVFVEAGAGAGKTTLIVSRIIEQLKHGIKPEQIVVITFTNAAAEELRGRIITKVRESYQTYQNEGNEEFGERLKKASQELDQMNISTIHSFCFKLLRERIFEAELPMDCCLLEEEEAQIQREKIFSEYIGTLKGTDWQTFERYELSVKTALADMKRFYLSICELPDGTQIHNNHALLGHYSKTDSDEKKQICRYVMLLDYAKKAREKYRSERSRKYLTNDDLLQKTYQLLCRGKDSERARAYFAKKYSCFYVDEFQDTDDIQEQFIWRLAADLEDPSKLRDGALFLVGDPKQSIYRFRGAQPEVYFRAKEKMEQLDGAKVYCLNDNFRSNETLISWVNTYFGDRDISKEPYTAMTATKKIAECDNDKLLVGPYFAYLKRDMLPTVEEKSGAESAKAEENPGVESVKTKETTSAETAKAKTPTQDEKRQMDAEHLGDLINQLVSGEFQIMDEDENRNMSARNIRYSDFLILCEWKEGMDTYLSAMQERGIPVLFNGEVSLAENCALNSYARWIDYLSNPFDRRKKIGAMEALNHAGHKHAERLLESVQEHAPKDPHGIAGYLLDRLELLLPVNETIQDWELRSVQTKLEQMYEKILAMGTLDDVWSYIDTKLERELSLEEQPDAVRFMNLHKAKGLEGNIVVLANRWETTGFKRGAFREKNDYYPAISHAFGRDRWSAYDHLIPMNGQKSIEALSMEQEIQEQTRLAYVAATRAKQVLIAMEPLSDSCMFLDFVSTEFVSEMFLRKMDNVCTKTAGENQSDEQSGGLNDDQNKEYEEYQENTNLYKVKSLSSVNRDDNMSKPAYERKSPSDFEHVSETRTRAKEEARKRGDENNKTQEMRPKGNIFGIVMHRGLQLLIERWRADFEKAPETLDTIIKMSAGQAIMENCTDIRAGEISLYQEYLTDIMIAFANWAWEEKLFINAEDVYTELPFSYYDDHKKQEEAISEKIDQVTHSEITPMWMNGTADLIVVDKAGNYQILDYKSDHDEYLDEEQFEQSLYERYLGQLKEYSLAVERLFGVSSDKISLTIISFNKNKQVRTTSMELSKSES